MEILNIYASGEGYISLLLLKDFIRDFNLPLCVRFYDRLLPDRKVDIVFLPEPSEGEREILKTFEEKPLILSRDCRDLENCIGIKGDFVFESLRKISENHLKDIARFFENYQPPEFENELLTGLREKLNFYIPLAVAKREAVLEAWRYYLGVKGHPFGGYLYPLEEKAFLNSLSNIAFTDKVFPLILGRVSDNLLNLVKKRGFVPFEVYLPSKNNIDSELNYILLASSI